MKRRFVILFLALVAGFILAQVAVRYLVLGGEWAKEPAELFSPDNVKSEYEWFYNHRRGLEAQSASIQTNRRRTGTLESTYGDDKATWPPTAQDEYMQLANIQAQLETAYNMACANYQARWDNVFHSIVAPPDIPRGCGLNQ